MSEFTLDSFPAVGRRERFDAMDSLIEVVSETNEVLAHELDARGAVRRLSMTMNLRVDRGRKN
jgi:hypothetical protein